VYLMDAANLAIRAGWPYTSGQPLPIHGISVGPLLCGGFNTPYLTFFTGTVLHKLQRDGTEPACNPASYQSSYPLDQAPIIAAMDSMSAVKGQAVLFGDSDSTVVGLAGNSDSTLNGFPCWVGDAVDAPPAVGDVDLNSRQDLVVLSRTSLHIYDVNTPDTNPSKDGSWPQYGYDPAHSFCYLCGGAPTVGVGQGLQAYRLGIAPVRPNPSRGAALLDFALPTAGVARLAVFDISGRLVREVANQVLPAGRHSARWDGRDMAGREAPAGVYVVKLSLEGQGSVSEKLMRLR
jgi:hypothetical protein